MRALALHHTVQAPGRCKTKGVVVQTLFQFLELRRVMSGVDVTVGCLQQLDLAHLVVLMHGGRFMRVPRWKSWDRHWETSSAWRFREWPKR